MVCGGRVEPVGYHKGAMVLQCRECHKQVLVDEEQFLGTGGRSCPCEVDPQVNWSPERFIVFWGVMAVLLAVGVLLILAAME